MRRKEISKKILLLFILSLLAGAIDAQQDIFVKQFPLVSQLPSNTVKRIFQDSDGYMWFGTSDGLCRYDGYRIITFRSNTGNPELLADNEITCLTEDQNNNIWIGTKRGISILSKKDYRISSLDIEYIRGSETHYIRVTRDGTIWVGAGNYIFCFNPDLSLKVRYDSSALPDASTHCIYEDADGNIWVCKWGSGLYRYDKKTDSFIKYPKIGDNDNPFIIFQDNRKQFWICTWGGGLFLFDPDKTDANMYTSIETDKKERKTREDTFFSIVQDGKKNYMWAMSFSGLSAFEYTKDGSLKEVDVSGLFRNFNNIFSEIIRDNNGNLWIGTFSEGIINIDFDKSAVRNINLSEIKRLTGITPNVTGIYKDKDGVIWFNQNRWGMGLYYPAENKIRLREELPTNAQFSNFSYVSDFRSLPDEIWLNPQTSPLIYSLTKTNNDIKINYRVDLSAIRANAGNVLKFHEDRDNNIWIVTASGVFVKPYNKDIIPLTFSIENITDITEDEKGNIWVSSNSGGFYKLPPAGNFEESKIVRYTNENSALKSNKITALCTDAKGKLWIGTKEGYVLIYDVEANEFSDISRSFRRVDEGILNILRDQFGHIWVSTNKRLTEFNPANKASRDYSVIDGISVNSFLPNSYYLDKAGNLLFGGNGGITEFFPSRKLSQDAQNSITFITDIKINNQSLLSDKSGHKLDMMSRDLIFEPDDKNIEIDFSSLNYSFPTKVRYAYKMEGVDDDWVYTDYNRQFAFYNQLAKGEYSFLVKSTDENGLWSNEIVKLKIYKKPAFYETWWAYSLYFILLLLSIYYIYSRAKNRIRMRNDLRIAQIEKDKSEELTQTKLRYFTNISHDFLTPLTIISCLIDDVETTIKGRLGQFDLMRSNINRLRRLLQQVLDFRKVESGNMKLKIAEDDIVKFVRDVCYVHFLPLMKKKNLELNFRAEDESIQAYFDADKIDKIIFNLLSNAYKYTPAGGFIEVTLMKHDEGEHSRLTIKVEDTGIGISLDDQKDIFTRFYTNKMTDASETNGIGLSLTKDLVELHRGTIEVDSTVGKGTLFTIDIPIDKGSYSELDMDNSSSVIIYERAVDIMSLDPVNIDNIQPDREREDTTILLVEDNAELQSLMENILSKHFHIETSGNGVEALSLITEKDIDIIISDVMMPEMDGIELCKTLKSNVETSHIPVILLTAKSSIEDRIECYNAGADGYISKPFELKLLEARINNFMQSKREKQRDFKTNFEINISALEHPSIDEQFLKGAIEIIEEHLSEPEFDVVGLAKKMNMSKSTLYRKIKTLTDLSPGDFIRNIKLKQACGMLKDNAISISEVAYLVGFSDPKYFSTCFKNEFGVTPSEYKRDRHGTEGGSV